MRDPSDCGGVSAQRLLGWLSCCLSMLMLAACGGGSGSSESPQIALKVAPAMANVMVGQQIQLSATTEDPSGAVSTAGPATWASSNAMVATVDATGLVKGLALGQATITARTGGQSATATITTTTGLLFTSISAGGRHTCGVTWGNVAYCWGDNSFGQLGSGTTNNSATPVPVSGGLIFANVSAGDKHTCGVTRFEGVAYCWGDNSFGQLGNGTTKGSAVPVPVAGGLSFTTVSAGGRHSCGGNGYCWGDNSSGQLGNGTFISSPVPVAAAGFDWGALSAGRNHTCGIAFLGGFLHIPVVFCWGDNGTGQLGDGTTTSSASPTSANAGGGQVSAGALYSCSWGNSDPSYCWGNNDAGQLGNGTTNNSATPVPVSGGLDFTSGSAGAQHACGVTSAGVAYCWGDNNFGQLGNGSTTGSTKPSRVVGGLTFAALTVAGDLFNYTTVTAGGRHTCGIASTQGPSAGVAGAVYCWGDNSAGQLGNGWATTSSVPVNVAGPQ